MAQEYVSVGTTVRPSRAFATQEQVRLLEALGWQISTLPQSDMARHAPLQCCFLLRDGSREEAAFGYTAVTAPRDDHCPSLRMAKLRVERFLAWLGVDSGVLLQNTPVFAFGGRRRDRVAVFGGWRFSRGTWSPFLLGPDGLGGVGRQDMLFARDTDPYHMAEVCGHSAQKIGPHLAGLMQAIEELRLGDGASRSASPSAPDFETMDIKPIASGWFVGGPGLSADVVLIGDTGRIAARPRHAVEHGQAGAVTTARRTHWTFGEDEFRFHEFGADRG